MKLLEEAQDLHEALARRLRDHIYNEYQLLPEFMDGLTSLYEGAEDYTCLTLKKLAGRREKGQARAVLFASTAPGKANDECAACPAE